MQQTPSIPVTGYPTYRWVVVSLYMLATVSSQMVMITLGILLPSISADLSLSPAQQGLLGSISYWAPIILAVPIGWAGSRMSPKWLTFATLAGGTLCLFVQSWAPVFAVLLAGRLLFGITTVAQQPARAVLTRQWFPLGEVIVVNGLSNVFFGIVVGGGLAVAPMILALTGDDWRTTIQVFGVYYGAVGLAWLLLGRDRVTGETITTANQKALDMLRGAIRYKDLWIGGMGFCGATMSFGTFLTFYPTLMLDDYGVSEKLSGGVLALDVILGGIVGIVVGYVAAATQTEGRFLQVLGILMIGSFVGMISTGWIPAMFLFGAINGLAWAFFPILITVPFTLRGIQTRELAVAFSITMMWVSMGIALGPLITGYLQELTGSLKLSMFIISFGPVTLILAGSTLGFGRDPVPVTAASSD